MQESMESYTTLDLEKLSQKKGKILSSQEALKDVKQILWTNDVLSGKEKVILKQMGKQE